MPINLDAVGYKSEVATRSWNSYDSILYALGVGAGHPDPAHELQFTTENSYALEQHALPTMVVVLDDGLEVAMERVGSFDRLFLVHGEHGIELDKPLPVEGTACISSAIRGIYDKGSGALVVIETTAFEPSTEDRLWTSTTSAFIRGEGGWGGDRGPSGRRNAPPNRPPDHEVTYETNPNQALIYRLSGDRNPLHADPWFAKSAGFDRPILHGLCTYGYAGRALLQTLCESNTAYFQSMECRFTKPVYPGDHLTVCIWVDGHEAVFQTMVGGSVVIDSGRCTFSR
jgi:acyl dehydratase